MFSDITMLFVKPLSNAEKITLKDAQKYHLQSWTRTRAHCILLSSQEYKVNEIASICNICRQAVSNCIHNWERDGFLGLVDEHRSGRPKALTQEQEDDLISRVKESPRSLKKVISEFSEAHQIEISVSLLKRLCKAAKMSWKRVRKSLKGKRNEEDYERSKNLINQLIESYKKGDIDLLYFDESGFSLTPNVPYAWQNIGEHIEIPSAKSAGLNVLGFVNRDCEFESFVFTGSITTEVVTACFDKIADKTNESGKPTVVLVDNAPTHTSNDFDRKSIEWCSKGLVVVPISKYSPELNIIEIVWRKIKYEWIPFSAYQSFENLEKSLFDILSKIGSEYKIEFC